MLGLKIENIDLTKSSAAVFEQVWNTNIMPLNLYRKDGSVTFIDVTPDPFYEGKENIRLNVKKWPWLDETSPIVQRAGNFYTANVTVDADRDGGEQPGVEVTITALAYNHKTNTLTANVTGATEVVLDASASFNDVTVPVVSGKVTYKPTAVLQANEVVEFKSGTVTESINITPLYLKIDGAVKGWDSDLTLATGDNTFTCGVSLDGADYVPTAVTWTLTGSSDFTIAQTGVVTAANFEDGETANLEITAVADGHSAMTRLVVTRGEAQ